MKGLTMHCIWAFLAALLVMAANAHAACSSCGGEADWSRSADEFMSWDPTGEVPAAFGLDQAAPPAPVKDAAQYAALKADDGENYSRIIALQSINATPSSVKSGDKTMITAVLALNQSGWQEEMQLSAQALIKDSAGGEVERLILIWSSAHRHFSNWVADVPPGSYRVDILASSPEEMARFRDAMQIEVVG